jgi:hypothetical protein
MAAEGLTIFTIIVNSKSATQTTTDQLVEVDVAEEEGLEVEEETTMADINIYARLCQL